MSLCDQNKEYISDIYLPDSEWPLLCTCFVKWNLLIISPLDGKAYQKSTQHKQEAKTMAKIIHLTIICSIYKSPNQISYSSSFEFGSGLGEHTDHTLTCAPFTKIHRKSPLIGDGKIMNKKNNLSVSKINTPISFLAISATSIQSGGFSLLPLTGRSSMWCWLRFLLLLGPECLIYTMKC